MKIRNGFVSNSSSSSFVIMTAGGFHILESGNTEAEFDADGDDFPIDIVIAKLIEAKENGATKVSVMHGGGYDG